MPYKSKKIKLIFFIYWFLLIYIIAALVWWFIALSRQNELMTENKINNLRKEDTQYAEKFRKANEEKSRKTAQYIGEGAIFFLLIMAGAIFVYRAVNRELKLSRQQHHFMMAITHELKTPIAVAKLNLETLQMRKLDESQQQRLIRNTLQETNRLNSLCNNMLVSSQIDAGGYRLVNEELDVSELAQNSLNDFITRHPQRNFTAKIFPGLVIKGDALLMQMALNNLLDNAIKYSPKNSPVAMEVMDKGQLIQIRVKDEGPGIAAAEKKKVFEKFYRVGNEATRHAKGTGLGLYLTQKIISGHNGSISILDNVPAGSIFSIELKKTV